MSDDPLADPCPDCSAPAGQRCADVWPPLVGACDSGHGYTAVWLVHASRVTA